MARVSVTVNVRDMTRGDLRRLRTQMDDLGRAVNRFSGNQSQRNLATMQRHFEGIGGRLDSLRGRIPIAEFQRLETQLNRVRGAMDTSLGPITADRMGVIRQGLQDIDRDVSHFTSRPRFMRIITVGDAHPTLRRMGRAIGRWATGPLRGLGGLISGVLSDGIGQGIIGAFRSPAFGALLVAAIVAAVSLVGAALAGLLVLAIGGAFVGLGAFIAAKSKEVTRNWESEMKRLKPIFKDAAEPLVDVLHRATHIMGDMGAEFAPHFKEALEKAAPHLDNFVDRTRDGLKKLGQGAWDSLQESFRVFLDAFGPQWEDFLKEMGESLGALARTVSTHSEEMAMALRAVLGVINLLIDVINFFANVWIFSVGLAQQSIMGLFLVMQYVTDQILSFCGMILDGLVSAFSHVPVLGPMLEEAQGRFATFKDGVVGKLGMMAAQAKQWGLDMDEANKTRVLKVDIASWENQLARAKEELNSVPKERKAEVQARIDQLVAAIARARAELNSINSKSIVITTIRRTVGPGRPGPGGYEAHGGVIGNWGTAATGGVRSNMTMVGEHGPEIVQLPPGSHVRSNPDTKRIMGGSDLGGGGGPTTLIIKSSGNRASNLILELLRDAIHDAGGDPVKVLGG